MKETEHHSDHRQISLNCLIRKDNLAALMYLGKLKLMVSSVFAADFVLKKENDPHGAVLGFRLQQ